MNDLYSRIMKLCEAKGITGYRMCKDTGLQPSFLTDLKAGRQHGMSAKKASVVANYFGVTEEFLLYGREKNTATSGDGMSDKDKRFIEWFRSLSPEKQRAILISQDAPEELL